MTANAFEEDKRDAIAAGMNGHIAKPIQVDKTVVDIIRSNKATRKLLIAYYTEQSILIREIKIM